MPTHSEYCLEYVSTVNGQHVNFRPLLQKKNVDKILCWTYPSTAVAAALKLKSFYSLHASCLLHRSAGVVTRKIFLTNLIWKDSCLFLQNATGWPQTDTIRVKAAECAQVGSTLFTIGGGAGALGYVIPFVVLGVLGDHFHGIFSLKQILQRLLTMDLVSFPRWKVLILRFLRSLILRCNFLSDPTYEEQQLRCGRGTFQCIELVAFAPAANTSYQPSQLAELFAQSHTCSH